MRYVPGFNNPVAQCLSLRIIGPGAGITFQKTAVLDEIIAHIRNAGHNMANRCANRGMLMYVQIVDRRARLEARTRGMTNTQIIAIDDINNFVGSIETIHLPIGKQADGCGFSGAKVQLVLVSKCNVGTASNMVPDPCIVQYPLEQFARIKSPSQGALLLSEYQTADRRRTVYRSTGRDTSSTVSQFAIDMDLPISIGIIPTEGNGMNLTIA